MVCQHPLSTCRCLQSTGTEAKFNSMHLLPIIHLSTLHHPNTRHLHTRSRRTSLSRRLLSNSLNRHHRISILLSIHRHNSIIHIQRPPLNFLPNLKPRNTILLDSIYQPANNTQSSIQLLNTKSLNIPLWHKMPNTQFLKHRCLMSRFPSLRLIRLSSSLLPIRFNTMILKDGHQLR